MLPEALRHADADYRAATIWDDIGNDYLARIVRRCALPDTWLLSERRQWPLFALRGELYSSWLTRRVMSEDGHDMESMEGMSARNLVHVHTQALALLGVPGHLPAVISVDDTAAMRMLSRGSVGRMEGIELRMLARLERAAFRRSAAVVAWSERARRSLVDHYGLPNGKAFHIPPPVDIGAFGRRDERLSGIGKSERKLRLLFVGGDFLRKGGDLLVQVYRDYFMESAELDVVSDSTDAAKLCRRVPGVRLHRELRPMSDELVSLYRNADVFVMPSRYEAYGLALVEAMGAGLPVISTRIMAIPEIVQDGVTGLLIEPEDGRALHGALTRLLGDALARRAMGSAGRTLAARTYALDVVGQRWRLLFESMAGKETPPGARV